MIFMTISGVGRRARLPRNHAKSRVRLGVPADQPTPGRPATAMSYNFREMRACLLSAARAAAEANSLRYLQPIGRPNTLRIGGQSLCILTQQG